MHNQTPQTELSSLEIAILELIQCGFPISADPYGEIAASVGGTREEAYAAVARLRSCGVIRRIGGSFDARKMGYVSALVAARIEPDHLEVTAAHVSTFAEVTHNYARAHAYNLWFTVIAAGQARLDEILESVRRQEGVLAVHELPALRTFKIKVDFKFNGVPADA